MTGFRDLRQNHDFSVLWVGQTVSELGTRVSMFVFPLITFAVTGSPLLAGIAGGLELLGTAIALLPGGLLADRVHRGRVMRTAAGAGVLLYASLVVAGVLGMLTVPHLFVVGVLTGVCAGVFAPAEMSAVRAVVPRSSCPPHSASSRPASTWPVWSAVRWAVPSTPSPGGSPSSSMR